MNGVYLKSIASSCFFLGHVFTDLVTILTSRKLTCLTVSSTIASHPTDLLITVGRAARAQRVVRLAEFEIFQAALAGWLSKKEEGKWIRLKDFSETNCQNLIECELEGRNDFLESKNRSIEFHEMIVHNQVDDLRGVLSVQAIVRTARALLMVN